MARPIILSNGEMHVGINRSGLVHDFYYPYVGGENHAEAHNLQHRVGVWVDGRFSWLNSDDWAVSFSYVPETLIGVVTAVQHDLGIMLEMTDAVDAEQAAFLRNIHVINLAENARDIRLFMHQNFIISNSYASDTVQYLPDEHVLVHYKGPRSFVIGGSTSDAKTFDQYTAGLNGIEGFEGSYRDAEDGELSNHTVEHGRVDSVVRFSLSLAAHDSSRVYYWIAAGKSHREALRIHHKILDDGPLHRLLATATHWRQWLSRAQPTAAALPERYRDGFLRSVLLVKAHIDKRGAVIASTDTTMLNYSRDTYAYCWPRDAAFALWPLIRLGYTDEALSFFGFCRRVLSGHGYLMHKYTPDGALGSSWHPYRQRDGYEAPPIQEDETAIVVFLFAHYYTLHRDDKLLREFYPTMIEPMANFLASYVDEEGLPRPTYDLWERLFLTSTYTTAITYAALTEAARLAEAYGDQAASVRWLTAAEAMQGVAQRVLFDTERQALVKGVRRDPDATVVDTTIDASSAYGAYMFGLYAADSHEVAQSFATIDRVLKTSDYHPGLARFENDEYNRFDPTRVGNPWYIAVLWRAQYHLECGQADQATALIDWVSGQMTTTGMLAEQFDPDTLQSISVLPLTWSQAEYVSCLLDLLHSEKRT